MYTFSASSVVRVAIQFVLNEQSDHALLIREMRLMSDKLVESEFGLVTNVGIWSKHIHPLPLPLPSRVSLARPLIYFGVL